MPWCARGAKNGRLVPKRVMKTITISHRGRVVALAAPTRFWLAEHVVALPDGHPHKRLVAYMTLYARDVLTRDLAGPYSDRAAEQYARHALINPRALSQQLSSDGSQDATPPGGVPADEVLAFLTAARRAPGSPCAIAWACGARRHLHLPVLNDR